MATKAQIEKYLERIEQIVSGSNQIDYNESPEQQQERIKRAKKDYNFFVKTYFPHYANVDCAPFHIQAAKKILKTKNLRAVMEWARGHAKSTHMTIMVPLWLKIHKEVKTMVLVSKSEDNAVTLLSDLQAELEANPLYIHDFGKQVKLGNWEEGGFATKDNVAFFARGRGQSPRGLRNRENRPDYIVCDDLDDDELVRNEKRTRIALDWVLEALFGALDMGRGRFIAVGNRIHKRSILAQLTEREGIFHTVVNALDKNGQPSWGAKYTLAEIQSACVFMGFRRSQKEYFNNPITEGAVFRNQDIRYKAMDKPNTYDALVCYTDPSFKNSSRNDHKATLLMGAKKGEIHILKAQCRICSVSEMVRFVYDLNEKHQLDSSCSFYMEANFIQDTLLDEYFKEGLTRGYQLRIRGDYRKKPEKFARIEATSPLFERALVFFNEAEKEDPDMKELVEQFLSIERGSTAPDDGPDAFEGGLEKIQKRTRASGSNTKRLGNYQRNSERRAN